MTKRNFFLLSAWVLAAFWISCTNTNVLDESFSNLDGQPVTLSEKLNVKKGLVLIYLSPECPLCKNYTAVIKDLQLRFEPQEINFLGVVSGHYYTVDSVRKFLKEFSLDLEVVMDAEFKISKIYNARITPEVHLINPEGTLVYSGAIDNWAISLGKKRLVADRHYLAEAVDNFLKNKPVDPHETKAVGCLIE